MSQHHVFNLPHRATAEIDIDAPIEQVFSYVTDPHNLPHWYQGVSNLRDVSEPNGVGQHFTWTFHYLGRKANPTHEVTDFEPTTVYAWRAVDGAFHAVVHFQFEQRNGGTRVTVTNAAPDLHFVARFAESFIVRSTTRHQQHSLEMLKDLLETHGPDHPR